MLLEAEKDEHEEKKDDEEDLEYIEEMAIQMEEELVQKEEELGDLGSLDEKLLGLKQVSIKRCTSFSKEDMTH